MSAILLLILLAFGLYHVGKKKQSEVIIKVKATSVMAVGQKIPVICRLIA